MDVTPPLEPMPDAHRARTRRAGRPRILIVDDDRDIRTLLGAWMGTSFDVLAAEDGVAAMALIRQGEPFDAAVLDVMMPRVDGFAVAKAIRELRPGTPVVMLSAIADATNRQRAAEAGVHTYLAKPFDPMQLKATLTALTRRTGRAGTAAPRTGEPSVIGGRCAWRGCVAQEVRGPICSVHQRLMEATGTVDLRPTLHVRAVRTVSSMVGVPPDEASELIRHPAAAPTWEVHAQVRLVIDEVLAEHAALAS